MSALGLPAHNSPRKNFLEDPCSGTSDLGLGYAEYAASSVIWQESQDLSTRRTGGATLLPNLVSPFDLDITPIAKWILKKRAFLSSANTRKQLERGIHIYAVLFFLLLSETKYNKKNSSNKLRFRNIDFLNKTIQTFVFSKYHHENSNNLSSPEH